MGYPVHYVPAGDVLPILFSTFDGGTGASITMTGLAVTDIEIYKDGSTTQRASDAGYTLLDTDGIDFDSLTGIHGFSIDTGDNTDASFYTVGSWFHVVVSAVTVDAQTVSFVAAAFRIMAAEGVAGVPDVNATHWNDTAVTTPPAVNVTQLSGDSTAADNAEAFFDGTGYAGTNNVIPTVTTLTGHTAQTGDAYARLGAPAGASVSADIAAVKAETATIVADTAELQTDWANGGRLDLLLDGAASAGDPWTTALPGAYGAGTAGKIVGDNLNATVSSRASQTSVDAVDDLLDTEIAAIKTVVDAILVDTDVIGLAGAGLTALATQASVNTIDDLLDTEVAAIKTVVDAIQVDTDDIQTRLPAALVGGRMDASVGAMAANTLTASALATDAVTEIVAAALTTAMTESYAADGAAPTLTQAVLLIQQILTELTIASTTGTIKKLDGTTTAATLTYDDATTPTSVTRAT